MNNLITFESFKPSDEVIWSVGFKSSIKNSTDLTDEEINDAIFAIKDPFQVNWTKEHEDKTIAEYKGTVGEWQILKGREIMNSFIESLTVDIDGDDVTVETSFEVSVPEDWDRGDVIEWCEGFHILLQSYLFVNMEKTAIDKDSFDKESYDKKRQFLDKVTRSQKINISKK